MENCLEKNFKKITIGLPCFNEEKNIIHLIQNLIKYLKKNFKAWEILVIDNHSTDNSVKKIQKFIKKKPIILKKKIKLIQNRKNIFYSGSVEKIINFSKYETILIMDSDNQFYVSDISRMFFYLHNKKLDLVFGRRFKRQDTITRKLISKIFSILSNLILGSQIKDLNSGMKILKKFKKVSFNKSLNIVNPEIYSLYKNQKKEIGEINIKHKNRLFGKSINEISSVIKNLLKIIIYLFKIKFKYGI